MPKKWIAKAVELDQHAVFVREAQRQSEKTGRRVTLADIIQDALNHEEQRITNRNKQRQS